MLYIPWVEFQFCIHYVQLPLEKKWLPEISKGGGARLWQGGGQCPPPPQMKP